MLMKFMEASEKRHDATDTAMEEQRTIMKNHHAMMIDQQVISEFLEALDVEPQQPDPKPKKPKLETEESAGIPSSRRGLGLNRRNLANLSPLERKHLEFIKQLKGIPINTPFIDSLAKVPEYAKFLQDLLDTHQQLKKNSKVILSEQSSKAVLGEIPTKMGDPRRLTLPCEFGNNMKVYDLADSGASINMMPYSFYKKLNIQKLKATKMTIHMANCSVTQPQGIAEDILVKIGKFVFLIDFVVLDMKEDPNVPIILGRPLFNTAGGLVDIQDGFQGSDAQEEVFNIDEKNELEELEKIMEVEIKTIQQVKRTKPRASVPFLVEDIAYMNPISWVSKEDDEMSSDEEEVTLKVTSLVVKEEKDTMELKDDKKLKIQGIKRKLDGNEVKAKKETSKKF
ncbi:uncharacterized protein LOC111914985 [Lactuca sativa]|uniref:uncharacterized protein LOC111914985 n=1 Tax=Lactuca sativa TaxID=4236 RepID=UPI000CD877EE|nr:uncharacterized protein LOC111914985 [Lactuca sativa]